MTGWEDHRGAVYALENKAWLSECARGALQIGMQSVARENTDCIDKLELLIDPQFVRVKKDCPKGSVCLVGCSSKVSVKTGTGAGVSCAVTSHSGDRMLLWVTPQFAPPLLPSGDLADVAFVAPFWFVQKATSSDQEVNMALSFRPMEVGSFIVHVPVMTNSRKLHSGEVLMYKETQQKATKGEPAKKSQKKQ